MRKVDLQTWPRKTHFEIYKNFDHPHFGMCSKVDLSTYMRIVKEKGFSINVAIVYVLARAANLIPEFRQRIHGKEIVEYEVVHPSTTILTEDELFSFCTIDYSMDFSDFSQRATEKIAMIKQNPTLEEETEEDNLLFMTAIPWVAFTSFKHPMHLHPPDSVPRFAWGKFFQEGESWKMPLDVQCHHALMDGIHVGRFYIEVQSFMDNPDFIQ